MKLNYNNKIVEVLTFKESLEVRTYFSNQQAKVKVHLQETFGENYSIIRLKESLSKEVVFCLWFNSEVSPEDLNLIVLDNKDRCILEVDNFLYFVSLSEGKILSKIEIFTPLIGLNSIREKLLILEEAGLKVVDFNGIIHQEVTTDLIKDFILVDDLLSLNTIEGEKMEIKLLV